nr:hypothetical protein OH820_34790 [Streptomyces sp. NBC_00857]
MNTSAREWGRAERLDADRLADALYAETGVRLVVEGPCPGGQVGAAYVRRPDGHRSVLKWRPHGHFGRARFFAPLAEAPAGDTALSRSTSGPTDSRTRAATSLPRPILTATTARRMARARPGTELTELPACGHWPSSDGPDGFARAVGSFPDRTRAPTTRRRPAR